MNPQHKAILDALSGPDGVQTRDLTIGELMDETDIDARSLDAAIWHLTGTGYIRQLPGGRYRRINKKHSDAVKRGQFVRGIPALCLYVVASYPILEKIQGATLWAL